MSDWRPMPTDLAAHRLRLNACRDDDFDAYDALVHERDPRAAAAPRDGRPTRGDLRRNVERFQAAPMNTGIGLFVVRVAGQFAGYCALTPGRVTLDEPELAYELLRKYQGNGYATEAACATVTAAAPAARLWATVRPWNGASIRVLTKIGFHRTGQTTAGDFGPLIWFTTELDG